MESEIIHYSIFKNFCHFLIKCQTHRQVAERVRGNVGHVRAPLGCPRAVLAWPSPQQGAVLSSPSPEVVWLRHVLGARDSSQASCQRLVVCLPPSAGPAAHQLCSTWPPGGACGPSARSTFMTWSCLSWPTESAPPPRLPLLLVVS